MLHTTAYATYALAQGLLAIWAITLLRKDLTLTGLAVFAPVAAVVWDNGVIAIGSFVGAGSYLEALTFPRFLGHALFTPSWIIAATGLALRAGVLGKYGKRIFSGSIILYVVMVGIGLVNEILFFKGELVAEADVLYYTNVGRLFTPPPPSLSMTLVVLVMGLLLLRRRWIWMAVGPVLMVGSQALGGDGFVFILINSAEVAMSAVMVATLAWVMRIERSQRTIAGLEPKTEPMRLVSQFSD